MPPSDWTEYQRVAERLSDRSALGDLAPPAGQPWRPTFEPLLGPAGGQLLLARAAAYAMHREQVSPLFRFDNMTPLIDQPPYVRALEELVAAAKAGGYSEGRLNPAEVFAEIRAGHCAMALTWPVNEVAAHQAAESEAKLLFAPLPGSSQAYRFATRS